MKFSSTALLSLFLLATMDGAMGQQVNKKTGLRGGFGDEFGPTYETEPKMATTVTLQSEGDDENEELLESDIVPDREDLALSGFNTNDSKVLPPPEADSKGEGGSADEKLFEGDIIPDFDEIMEAYGPEVVKQLEEDGMVLKGDRSIDVKNLVTNRRWQQRVGDVVQVPYTITSSFDSSKRATIENAVRDLGRRSGVVEFVPRTSQTDYIRVQNGSGCSSRVGRVGGMQELNLNVNGCVRTGTVQHEFLHALGFWHEQSRPDRDSFVRINFQNIENGKENNFDKQQGSNNLGSPYDYGSVMHYSSTAFSRNGQRTIDAPQPIGQRAEADSEDVLQMRLLYQCRSGARDLAAYNANRCTSDCKCWEGASGCNGNNDACQGNLVCSSNQCVQPGGGGGDFLTLSSVEDTSMCLDLRSADTTNGNSIWLYRCNGSGAQQWKHDSQGYLRSALDESKCIVGSRADTTAGTDLMIWDCFANDPRFQFNRYTDGTVRPKQNTNQCVDVSNGEVVEGNRIIQFYDCNGTLDKQWVW